MDKKYEIRGTLPRKISFVLEPCAPARLCPMEPRADAGIGFLRLLL